VVNLGPVVAAILRRRTVLRNVTLIAVTGSVGKTTTKECLAEILRRTAPTFASSTASNGRIEVPSVLLRSRPNHRFIVAEVGILKPGRMWRSALVLNPDVTVVTHVNWQHAPNFDSLDQVAEQKAKLLDPLGRAGLAVLNADNPRVAAMSVGRACRIRTFGIEETADVTAEDIQAQWPDKLSLTIHDGGEKRRLQTRFIGAHWAPSVLAAVATARALGATWDACADALACLEPFPGRLGTLRLPNGANLLRDEYNGSFASFEAALVVLEEARCRRRIIAIGHIRDTPHFGADGPEEVGRRSAGVGDVLLFWGAFKERYRSAALAVGAHPDSVVLFDTQPEMAKYIRRETGDGDLILLKGFWNDHMTRIAFEQFGAVGCRLKYCELYSVCDSCEKLRFQPDPAVDPSLTEPLLAGQARIAR